MSKDSGNYILIVTDDEPLSRAVQWAIEHSERQVDTDFCRAIGKMAAQMNGQSPTVAVVDIDPYPAQNIALLEPIISRYPQTRFLLLSGSVDQKLLLDAMQIGARHFMRKDSVKLELSGVLHRLVFSGGVKGGGQGSIVTVLSASGGCGATSIAVNVAKELCLEVSQQCLLVDMDADYGAIAAYLGVKSDYGISDVLKNSFVPDAQLVTSSALAYDEQLHILLSPCSVDFSNPAQLNFDLLPNALAGFKQAFPFTVMDTPRVSMDTASTLAAASRAVLIVMQMNVKDVHIARQMRASLIDRGVLPGRIIPVINRFGKRSQMISAEECKRVIGSDRYELIGNDYRIALRGINYGQTLSQAAPMSALRKDIRTLASKLLRQSAPI